MPALLRTFFLTTSLCATAAHASLMDQFIDPLDGKLDASQFILDNAHGFLPVPLVITDPAVGTGGGAALLFFHESPQQKAKRLADPGSVSTIPPSVTGVVGLGTSNGSHVQGVFHSGNWRNDNIRYLGGLFGASFNLKMYPEALGGNTPLDTNVKGLYFFQDIDFRLAQSPVFIGAEYTLMDSKVSFDSAMLSPAPTFDDKDASLGLKLSYDTRDNSFSPRTGTLARWQSDFHRRALGGSVNYRKDHSFVNHYMNLSEKWTLALRADAQSISGETPMPHARPYLDMRGMPAMRYQGDNTLLEELELRWALDRRWTLLAFSGSGKAFDKGEFAAANWKSTNGVGLRYLIARQLGLRSGIDFARGPEGWVMHVQFGGAW